ncbi:MAG TPA: GAF domain-containing protein [Naasia sp.]
MAVSIVSPALALWRRRLRSDWRDGPRPLDQPRGYAPGPTPDRVLVVGSGPATGWGVLSHDLALPGQLARRLSALTGKGADVDLVATPFMTAAGVARELQGTRLSRYDAVVVVLGIPDVLSLTSSREWDERMSGLVRVLLASCSPDVPIVLAGIPQMQSVRDLDNPLGAVLDLRARSFNRATRALCRGRARLTYVRLSTSGLKPEHDRSASYVYGHWADLIASRLEEPLTSRPAHLDRLAQQRRSRPDDEAERQADLDRMRIVDKPAGAAVQRIAALAREAFGTKFAAVTLIDGDRQSVKAGVGFEGADTPRAFSFCSQTIERSEATVIPDSFADASLDGNPLVYGEPGIRFYAGYPLESPGGYRIGALCVFDTVPRDLSEIDTSLLHSLAKLAERELALEARSAPSVQAEPLLVNGVPRPVSAQPRAVPAR